MTLVKPPADSPPHAIYDAFGEVICLNAGSRAETAPVPSGTKVAWAVSIAAFWGFVLVLVIARAAWLTPVADARPPEMRAPIPSSGVAAPI